MENWLWIYAVAIDKLEEDDVELFLEWFDYADDPATNTNFYHYNDDRTLCCLSD